MTGFFKNNPVSKKILLLSNKICTYIVFALYPSLLFYLLFKGRAELSSAIIVPLDGFVVLSIFRCLVNRPRPYEKFGVSSVIPKDKKGRSFPSRHVFSAFIIAFTYLSMSHITTIFLYIGFILLILAILIAVIRVLSGVHFISDVIAAFVFAAVSQIISFFV